ncbi:hypothetical protein LTR94_037507, partial [Friedmanniomyces endolithicus]
MEVKSKDAKIEGRVTTLWYGPVEMMNPRVEDGKLLFEARNINDRDHPTRNWSVSLKDGKPHLEGQIWESAIAIDGYRGTAKDAKVRAFKFAALPPL